ncbi:VanZ family protein [Microbacterium azadirachtae]|uniref:VanZ family protein n=1 Tax=Microbacterium azadirachtae TaxID=582680 RepID=UPI00088C40EB|nr:VanZ family protein [Microbacterium azadirachtae]SDM42897.1 VanZ like family protein [Microbacterium azadirachtae]SEG57420.1 VanZ like family protein [Microbacterium azadirachtae]SEG60361.1 VanZ like family protein [Microbacterium azadirachtae]
MFEELPKDPAARSRPSPDRVAMFGARSLLPFVVAGILLLTWLPAEDAGKVTGIVNAAAKLLTHAGVPVTIGYPVLEFLANVALFIPLGLCLAGGWPSLHSGWIVAAGMLFSTLIEIVQLGMPSRYATLSDVVANTVGTAVGAFAVILMRRRAALPR